MLSATSEYALRAVVFLCLNRDRSYTVQEIAESTKTPPNYLAKILQALVRAGLVASQRGARGGFELARPPDAITPLEVLRATDNPFRHIQTCPLGLPGHTRLCPLHRTVERAVRGVEQAFRGVTMARLARSVRGVTPLRPSRTPRRGDAAPPHPRQPAGRWLT